MDQNRLFRNWKNVLIVSLQLPKISDADVERSIEEMTSLAYSLGGKVVGQIVQSRPNIHPAYFFGKGKLDEIKLILKNDSVDILLVDNKLSPKQTQNLEGILECRILDRTQVILEIFAKNARTREAKLQIGLAQAEYLLPRLVRLWKHLDRERGGIGASRGTGEKQLEKDRQFLRHRITRFKAQLERVEKERKTQKQRRSNCLQVSMMGYTNAGKSTIMNALTNSGQLVEDRLFATLDSTTRLLEEDSRPKVLLSDTVGFINNLPHEVVAAFRSTLSTLKDADLLLHVLDASKDVDVHMETTARVLEDLDAIRIPILNVFNKIDRISQRKLLILKKLYPDALFISATNSYEHGSLNSSNLVDVITEKIILFFNERMKTVKICLDYLHSQQLANIYEWTRVDNIDYQEKGIMMTLTSIPVNLERLRYQLGSNFKEVM